MPNGFIIKKPGGCRTRGAKQVDFKEGPEEYEKGVQSLRVDSSKRFVFGVSYFSKVYHIP